MKAEAKEQHNETSKRNQNVRDADTDGSTSDQERQRRAPAFTRTQKEQKLFRNTRHHLDTCKEPVRKKSEVAHQTTANFASSPTTHSKTETRTPQKREVERPREPSSGQQRNQNTTPKPCRAPEQVRAMEKNHKTLKLILKPAVRHSLPRRAEEHDGPYQRN